ncbi:MAG: chaperone modulator CbpM [Gammaproteobacteria bacterium]
MDAEIFTGILVTEHDALSLEEMVEACGAETAWVVELVEVGVLSPAGGDEAAWRFGAPDLLRARRIARLARDFEAGTEAAALILDLLDEIERLRARLRRAGID